MRNNRNLVTFASGKNSLIYNEMRKEAKLAMKVKEVISLLEKNGWRFIRMKGDHRIYFKDGARRPIVVPGALSSDLKDGTLSSILREAGLK